MGWMIGLVMVLAGTSVWLWKANRRLLGALDVRDETIERYQRQERRVRDWVDDAVSCGWCGSCVCDVVIQAVDNCFEPLPCDCQQPPNECPDYFDYLDSLEAEREVGVRGSCTCDEAFEAMHDLESSCELHS
jgi:hypothetical protein